MIRQACTVDTDCPDGYVCVDGQCIPRNGGNGGDGHEKVYEFWGQYKIPAGQFYASYMDGVYIDGDLFKQNMPVRDGTIHIVVSPQAADGYDKYIDFGFPTYQNGQVLRIHHKFNWTKYQGVVTQSYDLLYNGYPYGMGLNTIAIETGLMPLPPLAPTSSIWFNVLWRFIMEVG